MGGGDRIFSVFRYFFKGVVFDAVFADGRTDYVDLVEKFFVGLAHSVFFGF